jgi:hypothetical protein
LAISTVGATTILECIFDAKSTELIFACNVGTKEQHIFIFITADGAA